MSCGYIIDFVELFNRTAVMVPLEWADYYFQTCLALG